MPVPATVVMTPLGAIMRTTLAWKSAMKRSPDESDANPAG